MVGDTTQAPPGPPPSPSVRNAEEVARKVVRKMVEAGINFLALDFDLTVLDIHTGGRWGGTPEELSTHIRPFFYYLIPMAIANGVYTAIVTFSPQVNMILEVLRKAFPTVADQIPIRGEDGSWTYQGEGSLAGKQAHMASAAEEFREKGAAQISRETTLLIDDDVNNIRTALENGVRAVWIDPRKPNDLVDLLLGLEARSK